MEWGGGTMMEKSENWGRGWRDSPHASLGTLSYKPCAIHVISIWNGAHQNCLKMMA